MAPSRHGIKTRKKHVILAQFSNSPWTGCSGVCPNLLSCPTGDTAFRRILRVLGFLTQVWLWSTATGKFRTTSAKSRNDTSRENLVLSVSPVRTFSHDSGALLGRISVEPTQNFRRWIELNDALARAIHLGAMVTIQEVPLRRA